MSGYVVKRAGRPVRVELDWRGGYLGAGEVVTADLGWCVLPDIGAGSLEVVEQAHDMGRSWAMLTGGVPGRHYLISGHARTSRGRSLGRSLVVRIALG